MSADRSALLCLRQVDGRYCTLEVGHDVARFAARPCRHVAHFYRSEWVEACQCCGGPLAMIVTTDAERRLVCGACCVDALDAEWAAWRAEIAAAGERKRRAELRRTSRGV